MGGGCWLGLDFGTSSVKALLVRDDGSVEGRASAAYATTTGPGGAAEQDPLDYLGAAREAIRASGRRTRPARIGLAGQTPAIVLVDEDGDAVRPALTWQDHRADTEARVLERELRGAEELFGTRLPWTAAYPPAKLLWLAEHEPETVARTQFVLQPKDYVGLQLTGSPLSDPWSSKGLRHVGTFEPVDELLRRVGFPAEVAPPVADAWTSRGVVTDGASNAFGLPPEVPVSVGSSDAVAAMLAVGAFERPTGFILAGTSAASSASPRRGDCGAPAPAQIPSTCAPLAVHYGPTESTVPPSVARTFCAATEAHRLASSSSRLRGPVFVRISGERRRSGEPMCRAVAFLGAEHGQRARAPSSRACA